jgi:hypothetical protein
VTDWTELLQRYDVIGDDQGSRRRRSKRRRRRT